MKAAHTKCLIGFLFLAVLGLTQMPVVADATSTEKVQEAVDPSWTEDNTPHILSVRVKPEETTTLVAGEKTLLQIEVYITPAQANHAGRSYRWDLDAPPSAGSRFP
jgi:hypothetical protein